MRTSKICLDTATFAVALAPQEADCPGRHRGQPVTCPYAAATTPGLTA